ncbi:uncharacterized protein [Diabrotica undecimpunctata]|uniref:uncharacterized protein n=1 Tax=Diabrotica undecimpunctata TaxID=50387 RepID=UPI003B636E95
MKADQISLVAKRDPLIRHFGENYLKKHKRAQISVACSNKMRECSRLLIEMRRHTEKKNLPFFDILNPMLFDTVVASARLISGYNEETKIYKAPSLAMHLGTTLKQICDLCSHLLMKDHPDILCNDKDAKLKELKRFKLLVNSQWSFEISSLAVKDLAEKKWNKPVLLPLTKDIIKFRNHVVNCAETNFELLQQDWTNQQAFKKVVDSALSLTILFNRRRIGDVQYVTIDSYLKNFACVDQTEYLEQLTESEKLLSNTYKRVVAGGKGSRPIIILFPKNVQAYIDLTLQIRNETNMLSKENQYLFSYPSSKSQWVRADVVIKKFANASGAENPVALTSNRLRKQIATVMQLINLSKEEYAHFAQFMGHTEKTHREYYEITQDAYQMAKMSKILVLFDKGQGLQYKGKSLEDIDIDPTKDLVEPYDNFDDDSLSEPPNDRPDNYGCEDSEVLDRDNSDNETTTKQKKHKKKDCSTSGLKGLRRMLKEKNEEISTLRQKVTQLQDLMLKSQQKIIRHIDSKFEELKPKQGPQYPEQAKPQSIPQKVEVTFPLYESSDVNLKNIEDLDAYDTELFELKNLNYDEVEAFLNKMEIYVSCKRILKRFLSITQLN